VVGLTLFGVASYLFAAGNSFLYFSILLALSGIGIGIFKTRSRVDRRSLQIDDRTYFADEHGRGILRSRVDHRAGDSRASVGDRRLVEGLYTLAGAICVALILIALRAQYPHTINASDESIDLRHTSQQ